MEALRPRVTASSSVKNSGDRKDGVLKMRRAREAVNKTQGPPFLIQYCNQLPTVQYSASVTVDRRLWVDYDDCLLPIGSVYSPSATTNERSSFCQRVASTRSLRIAQRKGRQALQHHAEHRIGTPTHGGR